METKQKPFEEVIAELEQEIRSWQITVKNKDIEIAQLKSELQSKTQCSMGVGDGSGNLFVYGNYESIKEAQKLVLQAVGAGGVQPLRVSPVSPVGAASPDAGPWQVDEWGNGRVALQSHEFEHDAALEVSGDFGSYEARLSYAGQLCAWLNFAANPAAPAAEINPADFITEIIPGDGQKTIGFIHKIHSGVRLTHKPTGTTAESTTERSSHANRAIAWELMTAKLAKIEQPAAVAVGEREALARLESACDTRAMLTTPEAYHSIAKCDGMLEALEELDEARRQARAALATTPEVQPTPYQVQAITTAYEQGVGKGHDAYSRRVEINNPYGNGYRCDEAWTLGYKEGKLQADRKAKAEVQAEPFAVLVREIGESSFFDSPPIKPGSIQHLHAKSSPHYDYVELFTSPQATQQDQVDASLFQWLAASDWYVGPDDFFADEGGGLRGYLNHNIGLSDLRAAIQAAQQGGNK